MRRAPQMPRRMGSGKGHLFGEGQGGGAGMAGMGEGGGLGETKGGEGVVIFGELMRVRSWIFGSLR